MRGQIVYIKGHAQSEEQAHQSYNSFKRNGWDVEMVEGVTHETVKSAEEFNDLHIIAESRLYNFEKENYNRFLTKVSCAINHVKFWKNVVKEKKTMAFLEHDAIGVMNPGDLPVSYTHLRAHET